MKSQPIDRLRTIINQKLNTSKAQWRHIKTKNNNSAKSQVNLNTKIIP
jgi:hypothetical protein